MSIRGVVSVLSFVRLGIILLLIGVLSACGGGSGGDSDSPVADPDNPDVPDNPDNPDVPDNPYTPPAGFDDLSGLYIDTNLLGEWTTVSLSTENSLSLNQDQSCLGITVDYAAGKSQQDKCRWGVIDDADTKQLLIESEDKSWERFYVETIDDSNFRIYGGELGVKSLLYSKAVTGSIAGFFPNRWFIGTWHHHVSLDYYQIWELSQDNNIRIRTYTIVGDNQVADVTGSWSSTPNAFTFNVDDEAQPIGVPLSGSYPLDVVDKNSFKLNGATNDILRETWNRRTVPLFRNDLFAGLYTGPSTTIRASKIDDTSYSVHIVNENRILDFIAQLINNELHIALPDEWSFLGDNLLSLAPTYNGLLVMHAPPLLYSLLPTELSKISETQLSFPTAIEGGTWHLEYKFLNSPIRMQLLPDNRYLQFDSAVHETGIYTVTHSGPTGYQITLDPQCHLPYTQDFELIENHWVRHIPQLNGDPLLSTYLFEPNSQSTAEFDLQQYNAAVEIENSQWRAKYPQAQIDTRYEPIPAINTIHGLRTVSADLTPGDVHKGATVFAEAQNYQWIEPFPACNTNNILLCENANMKFFPNGRLLYYSESAWGINEISGQILTNTLFVWLKYKIQDNQIIVGDDVKLDILLGSRRVRFLESCYDSTTWTNG